MPRLLSALRFVTDHWILALAVVVNLAIAAPADAVGYKNDLCWGEEGEVVECCTECIFFCRCNAEEETED